MNLQKKDKSKKICMVVLNSFINDSRVLREAKSLAEIGYKVIVVALYEDKLERTEIIDGIHVRRIFLKTRNLPKKKLFYTLRYLEFFIKSLFFLFKERPKVCHCHDLNTLPLGYIIKKTAGSRLIYDSHELESERSTIRTKPKWFRCFIRRLEHFLIKRTDRVIVVCDSIADYIKKQDNIKRPAVIRNIPEWVSDAKNKLNEKHFGFSNDYKIIIYQGGLFLNRGLEDLIDLMRMLNKKIILIILGEGPLRNKLEIKIKNSKLEDRVILRGYVPQKKILDTTSQADLGIVSIKKVTLSYYYALPNKFFEYILAGIPVATSDFPEMKKVVEEYNIGETFNPENLREIAKSINKIFSNKDYYNLLKENIKKAKHDINWQKERKSIFRIYDNLMNP